MEGEEAADSKTTVTREPIVTRAEAVGTRVEVRRFGRVALVDGMIECYD